MYACTDYDLLIMYKCVKFCEINIHSFSIGSSLPCGFGDMLEKVAVPDALNKSMISVTNILPRACPVYPIYTFHIEITHD